MSLLTIEKFGLRPVPKEQRQSGIWALIAIFSNYFMNPGTLLTSGMMIVAGLPFWLTVLIQVVAALIGMLPFLLFARAGVDHGIPGQVMCRAVFGMGGSRWITSILRMLCSIYWYAFQTLAAALTIHGLLAHSFNIHLSLQWVALCLAVLQVVVACIGFPTLKNLSHLALPLKLVIFAVLLIFLFKSAGGAAQWHQVMTWPGHHWHWLLVATWFNAIVVSGLTLVADASDFSRYTKSKRVMWSGMLLGMLIGIFVGAFFGAYCVVAGGGTDINPFHTLIQLSPNPLILILILVVVVFDNWTINVINLYTGGLSLCNLTQSFSRVLSTFFVGLIASALVMLPDFLHAYVDVAGKAGGLFAPLAGIILAWFLLRYASLKMDELYVFDGQYRYQAGFNLWAVLIILVGFVINLYWPMSYLPGVSVLILSALASACCFLARSYTPTPVK